MMKRSIISAHRKYVTIISVVLFSILVAQQLGLVYAAPIQVQRRPAKGVFIDVGLIGTANVPSFTDLTNARFSLVGTQVKAGFGSSDWSNIAAWVQSAHNAGLTTFIMVGGFLAQNLTTAIDWINKAASTGTDIVELDEVISIFQLNESALQSMIETGLAVNPNVRFIITDWHGAFQDAYSWTSQYPFVRVADDEYDNKSYIDSNIQLGVNYGKRAYTWLAFSDVSTNFDCYLHLNDWIAYVKQRNTDALFYFIGGSDYQVQWPEVESF